MENDTGDASIDTVILDIDMGCLVTLVHHAILLTHATHLPFHTQCMSHYACHAIVSLDSRM
jgi:hypothetical protein